MKTNKGSIALLGIGLMTCLAGVLVVLAGRAKIAWWTSEISGSQAHLAGLVVLFFGAFIIYSVVTEKF